MDELICITQATGVNDELELNKDSSGGYICIIAFFIKDFNCASDSTGFMSSILNQKSTKQLPVKAFKRRILICCNRLKINLMKDMFDCKRLGWQRSGMKPLVLAAILFISCWLGLAAEADKDFANIALWKTPTGAWANVGQAGMDDQKVNSLVSKAGGGLLINGAEGKTGNIHTKEEFQDVEAHIEFMVPKNSNSGVYFLSRYEVQVFDSWGVANPSSHDCGAIYERWNDKGGYEGHPPRINASKAPGEWQTFDVVFRAPRFDALGKKTANAKFIKVTHNGQVVHENVEVTGPTRSASFEDEKPAGALMLQGDHGPVVYRNIRIKSIKLP